MKFLHHNFVNFLAAAREYGIRGRQRFIFGNPFNGKCLHMHFNGFPGI